MVSINIYIITTLDRTESLCHFEIFLYYVIIVIGLVSLPQKTFRSKSFFFVYLVSSYCTDVVHVHRDEDSSTV